MTDFVTYVFANIKKVKRREKKIEEKESEEKLVANTKHFLIYGLFLYTKCNNYII